MYIYVCIYLFAIISLGTLISVRVPLETLPTNGKKLLTMFLDFLITHSSSAELAFYLYE